MNLTFRTVEHCPACGSKHRLPFVLRADGIHLNRCEVCTTLYLERVPTDIAALYDDSYFGLADTDAEGNINRHIGYESSYDAGHLDTEFYWAFRLADQVATWLQGSTPQRRRCLDVGAATGHLLNVFAAADYDTHGVELSAPACDIASSRGHKMTWLPPGEAPEHALGFQVITALEVIEHIEDLPNFFTGIHAVMADRGVFVGYFPSSDDVAFSSGPDYHWLHSSFEHLLYPSPAGIRTLLTPLFGSNVFVATFLTRQGHDLIPNTVVVAIKGDVSPSAQSNIVELFRQLAYINDRASFDIGTSAGAGVLASVWGAPGEIVGSSENIPYVAGVLCAKFGNLEAARLLLCESNQWEKLDNLRLADLLAIALHGGNIDWLRVNLPEIAPRITMNLIATDCLKVLEMYYDPEHFDAGAAIDAPPLSKTDNP